MQPMNDAIAGKKILVHRESQNDFRPTLSNHIWINRF